MQVAPPGEPVQFSGLPSRARVSSGSRPSSDAGTVPVSRLFWRSRCFKLVKLPRAAGIGPASALSPKRRIAKLSRSPSAGGMVPEKRFSLRSKCASRGNAARAVGSGPLSCASTYLTDVEGRVFILSSKKIFHRVQYIYIYIYI